MNLLLKSILFYLFVVNANFAIAESKYSDLKWAKLLHLEDDSSFILPESLFFLSKSSSNRLKNELSYMKEILINPESFLIKTNGKHPQCLFPARVKFILNHTNLRFKKVKCDGLLEWKKKINANKLTLVLASQFISNPASIMGHTFFKFVDNKTKNYINQSINYAAHIPEDIGVIDYINGGLFGGFAGVFSEAPYFEKIQEYSNIERRDLWEYDLNLSPKEIDDILDHIWELKHTAKINYLFATRNCSHMLLNIIETVKPTKVLTKTFRTYVLPHETIKTLNQNGLIREVRFIPSSRTNLLTSFNKLSKNEKKNTLYFIEEKKEDTSNLSSNELDVILNYIDIQKYKNTGKLTSFQFQLKNSALIERSKITTKTQEDKFVQIKSSPLDSHDPYRLKAGIRLDSKNKNQNVLEFSPGFHSYDDRSAGYLENSSFNFFSFKLSEEGSIITEKFTLAHIANMTEYSEIDPSLSWEFLLENNNLRMCEYKNCSFIKTNFLTGRSFNLNLLQYSFLIGIENQIVEEDVSYLYPMFKNVITFRKKSYLIALTSNLLIFQTKSSNYSVSQNELIIRKYQFSSQLDLSLTISYNNNTALQKGITQSGFNLIHDF